ncbi:MAG TPA: sensor domain-containing diguanylate cyclase [Pseudolabrys sp.]|jgi:diguanylate cyclase (GGDEF)-like protein
MTDIAAKKEGRRLAALHDYKVLDTPPEAAFDRITRLAKTVLRAPIAQISFIDRDRQWLKASDGALAREIPRGDSFCTQAIECDEPLVVPDAIADARFSALPQVSASPHVRTYIGVPLRTRAGLKIGALCVMDTVVRRPTAEEISILQDLAQVVMDELELRRAAIVDSLTGASSRHAFLETAARDIADARRHRRDVSCIVLDIDYFKVINDSHGHAAGDRALHDIVLLLKSGLRADDHIGRIGGEEFAIILAGANRAAAAAIGECLRLRVMNAALAAPGGSVHITISLGAATLRGSDSGIDDLLRRADDALYAAKAAGRNRLVSAERLPLRLVVR